MASIRPLLVLLAYAGLGVFAGACAGTDTDESSAVAVGEPIHILCGDDACHLGEDCENCPGDCGECAESCHDDVCQLAEGCQTCPADCGRCVPDRQPGLQPDPEPGPPPGLQPPVQWPEEWSEREAAMLTLVNGLRTSGGECPSGSFPPVSALSADNILRSTARAHAFDMAAQSYFDHDGLDGRDPFDRMRDAGYDGSPSGENIAAGNASAEATFEQWHTSDGHCRNIMSANSDEIGIGYAYEADSPYGHYWVQNFGRE